MKKFLRRVVVVASIMSTLVSVVPVYAGQWKQDATGWWYENDDGTYVKNNWLQDTDGKWYYFDEAGYMLTNTTTPDGYQVGSDGAMIEVKKKKKEVTVKREIDWSKYELDSSTVKNLLKGTKIRGVKFVYGK